MWIQVLHIVMIWQLAKHWEAACIKLAMHQSLDLFIVSRWSEKWGPSFTVAEFSGIHLLEQRFGWAN
jgi:hypothetical protein